MNALNMESPSQYFTSALDAARLPAEVGDLATTIVAAQRMEAPYAGKDEFESLLESIYASIASSPHGGASRAPLDVELRDVLDDICKAHET